MSYKTPAILTFSLFGLLAAQSAAGGGYLGAGVGQAKVDACDDLEALGATHCDDSDTGWKVYGGYEFNRNFALEAGWNDFGEVTADAGFTSLRLEGTGFNIDGKASIPLTDAFSIFAKLGVIFWKADLSVSGFGNADDDGNDFRFGLGAQADLSPQFALRMEWERNDFDGTDVDLLSVSGLFRF